MILQSFAILQRLRSRARREATRHDARGEERPDPGRFLLLGAFDRESACPLAALILMPSRPVASLGRPALQMTSRHLRDSTHQPSLFIPSTFSFHFFFFFLSLCSSSYISIVCIRTVLWPSLKHHSWDTVNSRPPHTCLSSDTYFLQTSPSKKLQGHGED